jgi:Flp pilus assembly protein TadB
MMLASVVAIVMAGYLAMPSRRTLAAGVVGAVAVLGHPLLGVMLLGSGIAVHQLGRIRKAREVGASQDEDSVLAIELVGLGVVSGLPFRSAASMTASELGGPVASEITHALRSVNAGQQPSISIPDIQTLFNAAETAESTGMPLAGTITAMAADRRRAAAAASRERLAKLPVKMLFPLAFLILPGFVLLTVVPPLISGLSNLGM